MSMRRPRIKAAAILPPKRSARESIGVASAPKQIKIEPKVEVKSEPKHELKVDIKLPSSPLKEKVPPNELKPVDKLAANLSDNTPVDNHNATNAKPTVNEVASVAQEQIDPSDNDVFKSPPIMANHKRTESFSALDFDSERLEESSTHKSLQGPPSPVKFRQRIRPTPFFGMRRNSTQGYNSDMEDEPRRQRHTSTSSNTGGSTPHRIRPPIAQRIRTESSCSNVSDYSRDPSVKITRKLPPSDDHSRIHAARKDYLVRFNGRIPEKSNMKMSDLIYYNPTSNPMVAADPQKPIAENADKEIIENENPSPEKAEEPQKEIAMPVPQLKLGPDGEMILDEQSLVIETTAEKEARETLANTKVIYMDEFSGNNGFYRRSKRTKDWTSEETIKFYRCLHTVGTDFSLMLTLFPNRSRRDLKLKFKKEEKTNLNLINKALLHPKAFNVAELKQELEKEQQELDAKQKEWEEINKKKAEQKKKKKPTRGPYTSRTNFVLKDGDYVYEQEVVSLSRKNEQSNNRKAVHKEKEKITQGIDVAEVDKPADETITVDIDSPLVQEPITESEPVNLKETAFESDSQTIVETITELPSMKPVEKNHRDDVNGLSAPIIEDYTYVYNTKKDQMENGVEVLYEIMTETTIPDNLTQYEIIHTAEVLPCENEASVCDEIIHTAEILPCEDEASVCDEIEHGDIAKAVEEEQQDSETDACNDTSQMVDIIPTKSEDYPAEAEESSVPIVEINKHTEVDPLPTNDSSDGENESIVSIDAFEKADDDGDSIDECIKTDCKVEEEIKENQQQGENVKDEKTENEIENIRHVEEILEKIDHDQDVVEVFVEADRKEEIQLSTQAIDAEMERFMADDLGKILTDLINGSLVVVASEDENDPSKLINEIYVVDNDTGALSSRPIDLPEDVVNCIVEELNDYED